MKTDFYIPIYLNKQTPFLAKNYILKTVEISSFLEEAYGDSAKSFLRHEQNEVLIKLEEHFGDRFSEIQVISEKIVYDLLEQLECFLRDAALAYSLFKSTLDQIGQLPITDRHPSNYIGNIPVMDYTIRIPQIFAHSFLDSLVKISNTLKVMTLEKKTPYIEPNTRENITLIYEQFDLEFPKIWDVRNSWQHIEDRMRGKDKNGKELNSKMLVLSVLMGNDLSYTISDGAIHSVSITEKSLLLAKDFVQKTWDCFDWVQGKEVT